jgi:hypothetical protein
MMAFAISFSMCFSHGCTVMVRASGVFTLAMFFSRVGEP